MKDWQNTIVLSTVAILEVIQIIDKEALQIALVVDDKRRLLGTVTDGDVRRGILKGISLNEPVAKIMTEKPSTAGMHEPRESILITMRQQQIYHIPVIDDNGCVVGLETLSELIKPQEQDNWIVIMAGGSGTRLRPLTQSCPKPLLKVGNKPLLETILESFIQYGYRKFYFAVNYKADMIEEHFGDGAKWAAEIRYLKEEQCLGTAGALSLLPKDFSSPIIVMNGDVLTKVNFYKLLESHKKHQSQATMCVREYNFQVPYGVVELEKHQIRKIIEKPTHRCFVSAGIYVLNSEIIDLVPLNTVYDMPTLFEDILAQGMQTSAFPVREYWLDIGKISDYEQANGEYELHFTNNEG